MVLDTSSTLGSFAASSSGWSPSLSFALLLVPILCSSSLSIYFVSRVSTLQDSLTLWCLSSVCGLWKWACLPGCPVVFLCQFHVSCVRIVGMASFSIPLFVFDTQRCVSRLLGMRMPHILRSCPAHPRIIQGFLSVSLFWHPNIRLAVFTPRCPRCALHTLDETSCSELLIVFCSHRPLCCSSKPNAWNESGIKFAAFSLFVSDFRIDS